MVTFSFSILKSKPKIDQRLEVLENKTEKLERQIDRLAMWMSKRLDDESYVEPLFDKVVQSLREDTAIAASSLQRKFSIGYSRASGIIDKLKEKGYIESNSNGTVWNIVKNKLPKAE